MKADKCWKSADRCEDCPADNPDNKCSEYLPEKKVDKVIKIESK